MAGCLAPASAARLEALRRDPDSADGFPCSDAVLQ
jgi:hypothetical protein